MVTHAVVIVEAANSVGRGTEEELRIYNDEMKRPMPQLNSYLITSSGGQIGKVTRVLSHLDSPSPIGIGSHAQLEYQIVAVLIGRHIHCNAEEEVGNDFSM